jgi:hypothetical protein
MGSINRVCRRRLCFIAGVGREARRLVISRKEMGIPSERFSPVVCYVDGLVIPNSLFSYEGSWLDWVQKEGSNK